MNAPTPSLIFREITSAADRASAAIFLTQHPWPFHARSRLTLEQARAIPLGPAEETRAWFVNRSEFPVALVRALDLQDVGQGSVLFDLRIGEPFRRQGIGTATVDWLVPSLFAHYPALHRIEATTRIDNHGMRRVLEKNGFLCEGHLRQTWRSDDGKWHDTALYSRLRSET